VLGFTFTVPVDKPYYRVRQVADYIIAEIGAQANLSDAEEVARRALAGVDTYTKVVWVEENPE